MFYDIGGDYKNIIYFSKLIICIKVQQKLEIYYIRVLLFVGEYCGFFVIGSKGRNK